MTEIELYNIWNYYLSLENDFASTSRFIEPRGQEEVFSFEFSKLLVLECTEVEAIFKALCKEIEGRECGNIGEYKSVILRKYPRIVYAEVFVPRWGEILRPFDGWELGRLEWWDSYTSIKHDRGKNFECATFRNTISALSALYILIFYLAKIHNLRNSILVSTANAYIVSPYTFRMLISSPVSELPDFIATDSPESVSAEINDHYAKVFIQDSEPQEHQEGNIWFKKISSDEIK